jgi:3-methyl-2-oxobutanoate hydroxymethyltransferase
MSTQSTPVKSVTVPWVLAQKNERKLTMLTAYDYAMARILDEEGVDLLLVGDSVATVVYGEPNTLSATMDMMLQHTRAVARASKRAMVIGDLPFLSYQVSREEAVRNAGRFLQEAGAQAVKLEGGSPMQKTIRAISRAGIPVVAHLGLTPQSVHAMGGYRMHGKTEAERKLLLESARDVQEAGAFCVVLECVQPELAAEITLELEIPTIGIGSGAHCDGQVLVTQDLLGMTMGHVPRFVGPVAELREQMRAGVRQYVGRTRGTLVSERGADAPRV